MGGIKPYDFSAVEDRWREKWARDGIYQAEFPSAKPKRFLLDLIPHPSNAGLGISHCRNYISTDVLARYYRMQGYNVLYAMGWDAFGLTTENEALATGIDPAELARRNSSMYRREMQLLGLSYDWSREFSTNSPDYYKSTQWLFLLLFDLGLVYREISEEWWCANCRKTLRLVESQTGCCHRCGAPADRKEITQWRIKVSPFIDTLRNSLDNLSWPPEVISSQRDWLENAQDWSVSRHRYWGAPVPLIHCPSCGIVPDRNLPVVLPDPAAHLHTAKTTFSLDQIDTFVQTLCPHCGGLAKRDCTVLSGSLCVAWHFLRFVSSSGIGYAFDFQQAEYWLPIDRLVGNAEPVYALFHARLVCSLLAREGILNIQEPVYRFLRQGTVHGANGLRMTKGNKNVVKIAPLVAEHGSDVVRWHLLSLGEGHSNVTWHLSDDLTAAKRRLRSVWRLVGEYIPTTEKDQASILAEALKIRMQNAIRAVTSAMEDFRMYTVTVELAGYLKYLNQASKTLVVNHPLWHEALSVLLWMLAPIAPFLAEELWESIGGTGSVHTKRWPTP